MLFVIEAIFVAVSALPVTSPVKSPVKVPAIAPVPVIVGDVNVLLANVWVSVNWTILLFVILAIFVAVSALPVIFAVIPSLTEIGPLNVVVLPVEPIAVKPVIVVIEF